MSEWQECKISEFCTITRGGSPRPIHDYLSQEGTPWVKIADATENASRFITKTKECIKVEGESKSRVVFPGDLILSNSATPGLPRFMKIRACIHDGWLLIRDLDGVDELFLYYLLIKEREALLIQGNGSIFTNLKTDILKEHIVSIPPLPEQKAIASVLSSLDDKIDLLHRQNKTLEAMAESLFRQWFVENEDGKEVQVTEIIDFNPRESLPKGSMADYLEMARVQTSSFHPTNWYEREFNSGTKFRNFDTLLARITPCLENGKTCYVTFLNEDSVGWGSTEFIVMRAKERFHPFVTYALSKNQTFRDYAEGCMEGSSGRQRVNNNHLKEFSVVLPSIEIISVINDNFSSITERLHYNFQQVTKLTALRDTLLPKLMSGEVKVEI
ncbi:restriction endonuclease subunit S [Spirochaeta isovalerica]|uniref:Type I restriction enzyme S subunit n=1 Tax=Spirochaeta isovalerica TaxID=150 RepID=A0A841RC27_9SPIO|nr:restriction endonuclease subunit S [Spirochaeta isovalerica]MBB6481535.1 type I restriction enzyme S subunit [Spirochaeta isovalerica]